MREYAIFLAFDHQLADLRREQIRREFQRPGLALPDRVSSVLRTVRAAITTPVDEVRPLTPGLYDYPYRS